MYAWIGERTDKVVATESGLRTIGQPPTGLNRTPAVGQGMVQSSAVFSVRLSYRASGLPTWRLLLA